MASPHTRGWTPPRAALDGRVDGFPAHAGMDPARGSAPCAGARLPRTRGDGPPEGNGALSAGEASPHTRGWTLLRHHGDAAVVGFPAHAGMDRRPGRPASRAAWLPRTRGDGPEKGWTDAGAGPASPHTRGWTRGVAIRIGVAIGFPAHAGMDLSRAPPRRRARGLPRTRGDGPGTSAAERDRQRASPHTRGWTRRMQDGA